MVFSKKEMSLTRTDSDKFASITKSLKFITWPLSFQQLDKKTLNSAGTSTSFLIKTFSTLLLNSKLAKCSAPAQWQYLVPQLQSKALLNTVRSSQQPCTEWQSTQARCWVLTTSKSTPWMSEVSDIQELSVGRQSREEVQQIMQSPYFTTVSWKESTHVS